MYNNNNYYEAPYDDQRTEEQEWEIAELMKNEYNPCKWGSFNEAFAGVQDPEVIAQLEEMLEKRDFEALGRKLWNLSYEYNEFYATRMVEGGY
jgi:hypothetical protein